jgi:nitrite reductase/ring-hydroxylating ferredoxin subunit
MISLPRINFYPVIYVLIILLVISGCTKEEKRNEIPVVGVSFFIDPNSTEYLELNGVGGWVPLTGGYKGIIVYRKSISEFMAFERACPYDWEQTDARIDVDASGLTATCPICNSKFILIDGTPYEGPTHYPLKQYQTQFDGNRLYIFN